jgi:O-antigen/teichoic acid export membrane protein
MNTAINMQDELGQRTIAGSVWMSAARLVQQAVTLIQIAVLARLLDPNAFGLVGLADLATQAIGIFVYTGYEFALIQKPTLEEVDIHTAWWIMLGRHLVISGCLGLLAGPIARLYRTPQVVPVLVAMALIQPIHGLASPAMVLFRRDMQFRRVFELDVYSAVVGLVVGIIAALVLRNVWALVVVRLVTSTTLVFLSYLRHPYRPQLRFSVHSFRQLSSYGGWMLGAAILSFVYAQGSNAFSGWMFGATALGLYQMASRFALWPCTQLGEVLRAAVMPAYSQIQNDRDRVSKVFLKTLSVMAIPILGVTALIALGLPRLLILVLGEQWVESAPLLPIIAIAGGMRAMLRTGSPLFLGVGRPRFEFFMDLTQAGLMALLLYPLGRLYGVFGLPFAIVLGALCAVPAWWLGVRQSTTCTALEVSKAVAPALLGVGVMTLVFLVGQAPEATRADSALGVIWHMALIGIASVGFVASILIGQSIVPDYSPLAELQRMVRRWRRQFHGVGPGAHAEGQY